jgi:hypothetical protein
MRVKVLDLLGRLLGVRFRIDGLAYGASRISAPRGLEAVVID